MWMIVICFVTILLFGIKIVSFRKQQKNKIRPTEPQLPPKIWECAIEKQWYENGNLKKVIYPHKKYSYVKCVHKWLEDGSKQEEAVIDGREVQAKRSWKNGKLICESGDMGWFDLAEYDEYLSNEQKQQLSIIKVTENDIVNIDANILELQEFDKKLYELEPTGSLSR